MGQRVSIADSSTSGTVKTAAPKQVERAVPAVKGLYVVEYASGRRSYVFRFRSPATGKMSCIVVGNGLMDFADVVLILVQMRAQLAKGLDPHQAVATLGEWFDTVYLASIRQRLKSWRDHEIRFNCHVRPVLGHRPVNLITPGELSALVDGLKPAPGCLREIEKLSDAQVNRIIALLKVIFSTLHAHGLIGTNPAKLLKCRQERNQRGRVLRSEEHEAFFSALNTLPEQVGLLIVLMLLTGMRVGEARRARWSQLDRTNLLLCLPDSKSGKPRRIPLSDEALALIERLRSRRKNDWLFPGSGDGPMSAPSKQFRKLVTQAGTAGLWLHDMRRSFSTVACQTGTGMACLSKILGHSHISVTERYVVTHDTAMQTAVSNVGRHFRHLLDGMVGSGQEAGA